MEFRACIFPLRSVLFFRGRQTARRFSLVLLFIPFTPTHFECLCLCLYIPYVRLLDMCVRVCRSVCVCMRSPYKLSPPKSIRSSLNLATQANTSNIWKTQHKSKITQHLANVFSAKISFYYYAKRLTK